jgi:hypothetical protein
MTKTETVQLLRREFFASAPLLFLGGELLKASSLSSQATPKGSELREELNPVEIEIVKKSAMAMDMGNFWGKGYS